MDLATVPQLSMLVDTNMGLLSPFTAVVFGLLSLAWFLTWLWGRQPCAIIVVGPEGSGKTTLGGELCTPLWAGPFEADSAQAEELT